MLNKNIRFKDKIDKKVGYGRVIGECSDSFYLIETDKSKGDIWGWEHERQNEEWQEGVVLIDGYSLSENKTYYAIPKEKVEWLEVEEV